MAKIKLLLGNSSYFFCLKKTKQQQQTHKETPKIFTLLITKNRSQNKSEEESGDVPKIQ